MTNHIDRLPEMGEEHGGFFVQKRDRIPELGAETVLYEHEASGASLLWIANDDDELGFNVIYRTPVTDETDANHVLEHAVAAASGKYPGKDVFFDMVNKSYQTYLNAYTYPIMTCYPVCSRSEDQLLKLMDVMLSCLTDPEVLRDPRIFQREGVRFTLSDPDGPLCAEGTVYSEDFGDMTDTSGEALSNMLHSLYPGLAAENNIGRAHRNLWQLTYERVLQVFEEYYTFDNGLIVLYGNLNCHRFLEFLNREYLSSARRSKEPRLVDFSRERAPEGYAEGVFESPAYRGDVSEDASVLEYGIDISEMPLEKQQQLSLFTQLLSHESSAFQRMLRELQINNQAYCDFSEEYAKNFILFGLEDANLNQRDPFLRGVKSALLEIAEKGVDQRVLEAVWKERALSDSLIRQQTGLGAAVSVKIGIFWANTGSCDYFQQRRAAAEHIKKDREQKILKGLAGELLRPRRSAFVATVPVPGMAEKLEEELRRQLEEKKSSMSPSQLQDLSRQTREFQQWNSSAGKRNSFAVSPQVLPEVEAPTEAQVYDVKGITIYTAAAPTKDSGCFRILLDTSFAEEEDLHWLALFSMLLMELPAAYYTLEEQRILESELLDHLSLHFGYPDLRSGKHHHPMLTAKWLGLAEDFPKSLNFLLELLGKTDFGKAEEISRLIEKFLPSYDLSRSGDPLDTAEELAYGFVDSYQLYSNYMEGQEFYDFLNDLLDRLEEEPDTAGKISEKLTQISDRVLSKTRCTLMIAAPEEWLPGLMSQGADILSRLPDQGTRDISYPGIEKMAARTAICVEAPDQCTLWAASFLGEKGEDIGFRGRYLPWLMAAEDKYLIPKLRFEGGAYDAGISFRLSLGRACLYTGNDPNVEKTIDVFDGLFGFLRKMDLTEEELSGYIVSVYGAATRPKGSLAKAMDSMGMELEGISAAKLREMAADIRQASLQDREDAADALEGIFRRGCLITMGNETNILRCPHCFERILNYKAAEDSDE